MISGFERIFHNPSGPITIKTHNTTKNNLWRLWELYKEGDIFWVWGKMSQGLLGGQYGFSLLVDCLVQLRVQNKPSNADLIEGVSLKWGPGGATLAALDLEQALLPGSDL